MKVKSVIIFWLLLIGFIGLGHANSAQSVVNNVIKAEKYIQQHKKENVVSALKEKYPRIFAIEYGGLILISPLHRDMEGTNQFYFKDKALKLVVQEEIIKAKSGGGWLDGRLRIDPDTGKIACRKIYIRPIHANYFIGSWYHYPKFKNHC